VRRVGEIEDSIVEAPAWSVGADDALVELLQLQVRAEAVKSAERITLFDVHIAGDEATLAIDFAVIHAGPRLTRIRLYDPLTPTMSPFLPVTPDEIVREALAAALGWHLSLPLSTRRCPWWPRAYARPGP
jgi:hypothetical protein